MVTAKRGKARSVREKQDPIVEILSTTENMTLSELVEALSRERGLRLEEAAKEVFMAWKKGRIDLVEPTPPRTILSYTMALRSLWFFAVTALVLITVFIVLSISRPPLVYIRYVLGSIFVLYLPGAMLIEALYPRGEDLEPLERLALSIGLSLAVVPLIGLVLNYTPWGIRLVPVLISLAIFTESMAVLALTRKYKYYKIGLEAT